MKKNIITKSVDIRRLKITDLIKCFGLNVHDNTFSN